MDNDSGAFRFIGLGVAAYDHAERGLPHRPGLTESLADLAGRLRQGVSELPAAVRASFSANLVEDPSHADVEELFARGPWAEPDTPEEPLPNATDLMVMWAGHGMSDGNTLLLATRDTFPGENTPDAPGGWAPAVAADRLVGWAAASQARQLLVAIDCCTSGTAIDTIGAADAVANRTLVNGAADTAGFLWIGILTASGPDQQAAQGLLAYHLGQVLSAGPVTGAKWLAWAANQPMVIAADVVEALRGRWRENVEPYSEQRLHFVANPLRSRMAHEGEKENWRGMFANPLYRRGTGPQIVQHPREAARGAGTGAADGRVLFSGRAAEADTVVARVRSTQPGLWTLTGPPGTGKSALIGRIVSLSDPAERLRILTDGGPLHHEDPGERVVSANVHARNASADDLAEQIDRQLIGAHVIGADMTGRYRNAEELVAALRRADTAEALTSRPVIVFDGLDEARGLHLRSNGARREAFDIAERLVIPLAESAVVLVATRDLADDGPEGRGLIDRLCGTRGPDLDLGSASRREGGRTALREYVVRRLTGIADDTMDPHRVADHLLADGADAGHTPFLLARLLTDELAEHPVDTRTPDWSGRLARTVAEAVEADLSRLPADAWPQPTGTAADHARVLLTVLGAALGNGFPQEEWLSVASYAAREEGLLAEGEQYTAEDIDRLLDSLGRYVIQDVFRGQDDGPRPAVYRISHQGILDALRPPFVPTRETPFDPAAIAVANALLNRSNAILRSGGSAPDAPYLWEYQTEIAGRAGEQGIQRLEELPPHDGQEWKLASVMGEVGERLLEHGHTARAVDMLTRCVAVWRTFQDQDLMWRGALAENLDRLAVAAVQAGDPDVALHAFDEAVEHFEAAIEGEHERFARDELARCLINRAEVIHPTDARQALADVERGGELAEGTQDRSLRVHVLSGRAFVNHALGRPREALEAIAEILASADEFLTLSHLAPRAEDAGSTGETGADEDESLVEAVALGLMNSAGILFATGRPIEGMEAGRRAVSTARALYVRWPGLYRRLLALSLQNLTAALLSAHLTTEAMPVAREAFEQARRLHEETGAHSLLLGSVRNNLAMAYCFERRFGEALPHSVGAVAILRELVDEQPASIPALASALLVQAVAMRGDLPQTGNLDDAVRRRLDESSGLMGEAIGILDELLATDPERHSSLWVKAMTQYFQAGPYGRRPHEDATRAERAVTLAEELYRANPDAHRPVLAQLLTAAATALTQVRDATPGTPTEPEPSPGALGKFLGRLPRPGLRKTAAAAPSLDDLIAAYDRRAVDLLTLLADADPDGYLITLCSAQRDMAVNLAADSPRQAAELRADAVRRLRPYGQAAPDVYGEELAESLHAMIFSAAGADRIALREELIGVLEPAQGRTGDTASATRHRATRRQVEALTEAGRTEEAAGLWARVLDPEAPAATLRRRLGVPDGEDPACVVTYLREALADPGTSPFRRYWLRQAGRVIRAQDPEGWDQEWTESGEPLPDWYHTSARQVADAYLWLVTPSLAACHTHLVAHPELLETEFDAAFEEAAEAADRFDDRPLDPSTFRAVRWAGTRDGLAATTEEAVRARITRFCEANPQEQVRLLLTERTFLHNAVEDLMPEITEADNDNLRLVCGLSLLTLSIDPSGLALFTPVAEALGDPDVLAEVCREAGRAGAGEAVLYALFFILISVSDELALVAYCGAYLAIARARAHGFEAVRDSPPDLTYLRSGPGTALGDRWRADLAELLVEEPELAPLADLFDSIETADR
ncbi:hypothetical protein [Streptomyces sp. NPDC003952]